MSLISDGTIKEKMEMNQIENVLKSISRKRSVYRQGKLNKGIALI